MARLTPHATSFNLRYIKPLKVTCVKWTGRDGFVIGIRWSGSMKKPNLFYIGSALLAVFAILVTPKASCAQRPIPVRTIQRQLKTLALTQNNAPSAFQKKIDTIINYLDERGPSIAFGLATCVVSGLGTDAVFKNAPLATLVGLTVGTATYVLSRFFSEPKTIVYYRFAHETYNAIITNTQGLLNQTTSAGLTAHIWLTYNNNNWPLIDALADCSHAQRTCKDILYYLDKSKEYKTIPVDKNLITKRIALRKLVNNTVTTLNNITTFIVNHPQYAVQIQLQAKAQKQPKSIIIQNIMPQQQQTPAKQAAQQK